MHQSRRYFKAATLGIRKLYLGMFTQYLLGDCYEEI